MTIKMYLYMAKISVELGSDVTGLGCRDAFAQKEGCSQVRGISCFSYDKLTP
jgi:hypothetical protein